MSNLSPETSDIIATMLSNAGKVWEQRKGYYESVPWYYPFAKLAAWKSMHRADRQFVAYINLYGDFLAAENCIKGLRNT